MVCVNHVVYWHDVLPHAGRFTLATPTDIIHQLEVAIRLGDSEAATDAGLKAAAMIRSWCHSLHQQGERLERYPLTGPQYLWSALALIAQAGPHSDADGVWNVLRRAEANLKSWWLERAAQVDVVTVVDVDSTHPYLTFDSGGRTTNGWYRGTRYGGA